MPQTSIKTEWEGLHGHRVCFELIVSLDGKTIVLDEVLQTSEHGNVNDVPDDVIDSLREDFENSISDAVVITNWSVTSLFNPYQAPECTPRCLRGNVYNHPERVDGKEITTSNIKSVDGRLVTCASRKYYLWGPPSDEYVQWCIKNNVEPPTEEVPLR